MRKITYGGATSLDNFLARPDGALDWLMWSKDVSAITEDFWKGVDTVLMGRKTFEAAVRMGQSGGPPGIQTYVFSRTMSGQPAGVTVVRDNAVDYVRNLRAGPGQDICLMGGGEFAQSLFEADLIDEVGFNIHPILLGAGIPALLPMNRQINLELKQCRQLSNGCVYLLYRVRR